MRSLRFAVALGSLVGSIAGCGEILGGGDDPPTSTTPPSSVDASEPQDSAILVDAGVVCKKTHPVILTPDYDTCLDKDQCAGSISYGDGKFCYIANDRKLIMRFNVGGEAESVAGGRVVKAQLVLTDNRTADGDPGYTANPLLSQAGTIRVHVMRNDWDEGNGSAYSGADSCRRTHGNPSHGWGPADAGASDASTISRPVDFEADPVSTTTIGDAISAQTFELDATRLGSGFTRFRNGGGELSLLVANDAPAAFIVGTRETKKSKQPLLLLDVCDPDG